MTTAPTHVPLFAFGTSASGHNAELRGAPLQLLQGFGPLQEAKFRQLFERVRPSLNKLKHPAWAFIPLDDAGDVPDAWWGLCRLYLQGRGSLGWVATIWSAVFSVAELDAMDWRIDSLIAASFWPAETVAALPADQRWPDTPLQLAVPVDPGSPQARVMDHLLPSQLPDRLLLDTAGYDQKALLLALLARIAPADRRFCSFSTLPLIASDVRILFHTDDAPAGQAGDISCNVADYFGTADMSLPLAEEFRRAISGVVFPQRQVDEVEAKAAATELAQVADFGRFSQWQRVLKAEPYTNVLVQMLPVLFSKRLAEGDEAEPLLRQAISAAKATSSEDAGARFAPLLAECLVKYKKLAAAKGEAVAWLATNQPLDWLVGHTSQLDRHGVDFKSWWPHLRNAQPEAVLLAAIVEAAYQASQTAQALDLLLHDDARGRGAGIAGQALEALRAMSNWWYVPLARRPTQQRPELWQQARLLLAQQRDAPRFDRENAHLFLLHRQSVMEARHG